MEGMDQPNPADIKEYLDMGWVHKELIPFLEEVFTDDEGMSTSNWERMILFARFNLDKIPVHEDFPSTIERLRLCLINASLLTSYELGKFMRIASMGPQTCVRVFVRHAIRHGPYRLHSLGDGPNPCSPRPEQDGTQAAVVIIPKPPKPDVVKKLEAEVKALTLKLENMYGMNPQPYTAMPHYQQQTRLDIQRQAFDSYAPPASFPIQAPHVWSHNQHPHNSEHPTFPSESTTGFQRIQLEQTRPAPQQVQKPPESEDCITESKDNAIESGTDAAVQDVE
ncbi:hypothetical protein A1F94_008397 [Pyrenophora tritici-repentis]|nr:hypothetical protein A1F94_008397 [Pyrenophora tritici-repentis]